MLYSLLHCYVITCKICSFCCIFQTLLNRPLQVDIASGKSGGGGGFDDMGGRGDRRRYDFGDDRTAGDWRRGGDSNHDMSPPYEGGRRYGGGDSYDRR